MHAVHRMTCAGAAVKRCSPCEIALTMTTTTSTWLITMPAAHRVSHDNCEHMLGLRETAYKVVFLHGCALNVRAS